MRQRERERGGGGERDRERGGERNRGREKEGGKKRDPQREGEERERRREVARGCVRQSLIKAMSRVLVKLQRLSGARS